MSSDNLNKLKRLARNDHVVTWVAEHVQTRLVWTCWPLSACYAVPVYSTCRHWLMYL